HVLVDEQERVEHRKHVEDRELPAEDREEHDARDDDEGERPEAAPTLLAIAALREELDERPAPEDLHDEGQEHDRDPELPDGTEEEVLPCAVLLQAEERLLGRVLVDDADPLVMEIVDVAPRLERDEAEDARDRPGDVAREAGREQRAMTAFVNDHEE